MDSALSSNANNTSLIWGVDNILTIFFNVLEMLLELEWESQESRLAKIHLSFMYKIIHNLEILEMEGFRTSSMLSRGNNNVFLC